MDAEQQQEQQLQVFIKGLDILREAPDILKSNQAIAQRVIIAGDFLLSQIKENGGTLNDELDETAKQFIIKNATRLKEMNGARAPITQLITQLSKKFTSQEALIDKDTVGTPAYKLQKLRDAFQKWKAEEAERIRQENVRKERKASEEGSYQSQVLVHLTNFVTDNISARKTKMQKYLNDATLEDIDGRREELKKATFNTVPLETWEVKIPLIYLSAEEAEVLRSAILDGNIERLNGEYLQSLDLFRNQLVDQVETKRTYLLELKQKAYDKEASDKLQREEDARQKALADEQREKEEELKEKATQQGNNIAASAKANSLFQGAMAQRTVTNAPEKPTHYDIVLEGAPMLGYMQILNAWMQEEGVKMMTEELDKTKFITAKNWAANRRLRDGFIIESPNIRYIAGYKAKSR